ncbi:MAG: LPS translocon maturation chaperone LptM [Candidatus Porifericomitaceae bacterium WSBS_2022_MAG_OTU9]
MKPQYILAAIILACFLVGCGQKGPLKKPPQPEEAVVCNCA